ncbi:unnamed protein product [Bursaphelenchus xylophilus]|uniref:(pine wood nematode) hypothetical protein n=1 Tax=Bursaphelenchus xylophilus TaxID=6326 RepID=A0A1I7SCP3_BURXY|nr:unnamed protein product [Bursaphelenchus xylophilus]CAG9093748.1 unnamed protein product [Bursaphelenchus xylophilus]
MFTTSVILLLLAPCLVLSSPQRDYPMDDQWEEHKVLGRVSCKKDQALVTDTKISLWLKAWDVFVPTFHECTNHPNGTALRYTLVHPDKDGRFKIKCSIDMSAQGITANYLQLYLQHHCSESGELVEKYYDVDFQTPYFINQTIELFTVDLD